MADWNHKPTRLARELRRNGTNAEFLLWRRLRNRGLSGRKFRRQYAVGRYVVDFACIEIGLIFEIDGGQHALQTGRDAERTAWLETRGFRVLRFWNNDVFSNIEGVLATIETALKGPHPNPLPQAEEGVPIERGTRRD